ncbi:hypothetical protein O181_092759, partial [Austropuccinia psidii MF-1]|nr:hypothetical protein [Austropuccinia psidii MF-1]
MTTANTPTRSMIEIVNSLRKQLATAYSNSNTTEVKNILNQLKKEVVPTEELIRTTKIGIAVAKQRQNSDPEVAKLAKMIVTEWKHLVKAPSNQVTSGGSQSANSTNQKSPNPNSNQTLRSPPALSQTKASSTSSTPLASLPKPAASLTATSSSAPLSSLPKPSTAISKKTGPRSSRTEDQSLDFEFLQDKVRNGSLRAVFDALIFDSDAPADLVHERAKSIELEVNRTNDSTGYKNKMRSLIFNLRDKNNPGLREAVVSGELGASKLCRMGPQDMASEERKAQDRKLAEENLFKARGAGPQQAETDAFRCGRCGLRKCTYYQMQTRSADEPMTTFVTCVNCNNRWK